mmetsp:Transcript_11224/g.16331  ORF Transcript_11224/g.16331 Transcript_11224/m.16331 type:complete len:204 (+) Transcript_11224:764-1375(+)
MRLNLLLRNSHDAYDQTIYGTTAPASRVNTKHVPLFPRPILTSSERYVVSNQPASLFPVTMDRNPNMGDKSSLKSPNKKTSFSCTVPSSKAITALFSFLSERRNGPPTRTRPLSKMTSFMTVLFSKLNTWRGVLEETSTLIPAADTPPWMFAFLMVILSSAFSTSHWSPTVLPSFSPSSLSINVSMSLGDVYCKNQTPSMRSG